MTPPYPVLPQFPYARSALQKQHSNRGSKTATKLKEIMGNTRTYQLLGTKKDHDFFSALIQQATIGLFLSSSDQQNSHSVFKWFNKRITGQYDCMVDSNYDRVIGKYHYYRFFWPSLKDKHKILRRGFIEIEKSGSAILFNHRSASAPDLGSFEDQGFSFFARERLYMLGVRENNIRLGIADIPDSLQKDPCRGIVLSTRTQSKRIFSAFFVMYHETHPSFKHELQLDDIKQYFSETVCVEKKQAFMYLSDR